MFSLGFKEGLQGVLTCDKALQMSVQDVRGYFSYDFQQCLYEACSLVWAKIKKNLETYSCWIKTWFLLFGIIDFGRSGVNIDLWISSTRFPSLFCPFFPEKKELSLLWQAFHLCSMHLWLTEFLILNYLKGELSFLNGPLWWLPFVFIETNGSQVWKYSSNSKLYFIIN